MTTWTRPTLPTTSWARAWLEKKDLTWEEATIAWEAWIQQWQNLASTTWSNKLSDNMPNTSWS